MIAKAPRYTVTKTAVALLIVCAAALGCEKDPARVVKIVERPATVAAPAPAPAEEATASDAAKVVPVAATASAPEIPAFHLDACPPLPEQTPGSGTLQVSGPCAFEQRTAASCEALADDFIMVSTRKGQGGATVMVYVNVEKYTGPGNYSGAQMFVGVQHKVNIWRWSSDVVNVTVGKDETFADLAPTRLQAEPVLVDCTGPMTNFQCSGRGDGGLAFEKSSVTVTGRLECEPAAARAEQ